MKEYETDWIVLFCVIRDFKMLQLVGLRSVHCSADYWFLKEMLNLLFSDLPF